MDNLIIENFNGRDKVELTTEMEIYEIRGGSGRSITNDKIDILGFGSWNNLTDLSVSCTVKDRIDTTKKFKVTIIIEPID